MYQMFRSLYLQWSLEIIYQNYTYSHLYLGKQLIFSILPSHLGFKNLSEPLQPIISHHSIQHSPSSGLFLFTTHNNPQEKSPRLCRSRSTMAGRRWRWMHPHLWEISSADNSNTYYLKVFFSLSCQRTCLSKAVYFFRQSRPSELNKVYKKGIK